MVVNRSYELAPWADILYGGDQNFWEQYPKAFGFVGLKVTSNEKVAARHNIHHVEYLRETDPNAHKMVFDRTGLVAHGGNTGFKAVNLSAQFKPRAMMLIGFDMIGKHWHEDHAQPLKNPRPQTMEKWRERLDAQAASLRDQGMEVVNCSEISLLASYRKMSVQAALQRWAR